MCLDLGVSAITDMLCSQACVTPCEDAWICVLVPWDEERKGVFVGKSRQNENAHVS